MARKRTSARELARLLEAVPQPVYALDDRMTILYANEACLEWAGHPAEQLLGRRCAYHSNSEVSGVEAAAAGLCPPPGTPAGGETTGFVSALDAEGRWCRRRARFIGLGTAMDDAVGIWAIVEASDLDESAAAAAIEAETSEAARLHALLGRFRRHAAEARQTGRLVGESPAIRRARARIAVAAPSGAPVIFVGPAGSGRRHAARAVHDAGESAQRGAMVPLACALLGADLIRSTVAALASRPAPEEPAGRGSLLLADADQVPREVQADLASAVSARSFPLRLMSTSAVSLLELARRGEYCEDLASVLSTIEIELPSLASRREDLPLLAQALLEEQNVGSSRQLRGFTSEALDLLDAYAWPGNVDELVDMVGRACQEAEGVEIGVGDLPAQIRMAVEAAAHPRRVEETIVLDDYLAGIERELIERALRRSKGNKAKAARLLGVTRPRLYRRMVQLGLAEDQDPG